MTSDAATSASTASTAPGNSADSMDKIKTDLDNTIGLRYWQLYYAVVFWSNVATPLNLAITILSALTTAEVATADSSNPPPLRKVKGIVIAMTVLAALNSVLAPATRVTDYMRLLNRWHQFGADFEELKYKAEKDQKREDFERLLNTVNKFDASSALHPASEAIAMLLIAIFRRNNYAWTKNANPEFNCSVRCCFSKCWPCCGDNGNKNEQGKRGNDCNEGVGKNRMKGQSTTQHDDDTSNGSVPAAAAAPAPPEPQTTSRGTASENV